MVSNMYSGVHGPGVTLLKATEEGRTSSYQGPGLPLFSHEAVSDTLGTPWAVA